MVIAAVRPPCREAVDGSEAVAVSPGADSLLSFVATRVSSGPRRPPPTASGELHVDSPQGCRARFRAERRPRPSVARVPRLRRSPGRHRHPGGRRRQPPRHRPARLWRELGRRGTAAGAQRRPSTAGAATPPPATTGRPTPTTAGSDWYFESIPGSGGPGRGLRRLRLSRLQAERLRAHDDDPASSAGWPSSGRAGRSSPASPPPSTGPSRTATGAGTPTPATASGPNGNERHRQRPQRRQRAVQRRSIQKEWAQHLVTRWGSAANGGVRYYIYDNEPSIWHATHRDVHPAGADDDRAARPDDRLRHRDPAGRPRGRLRRPGGVGLDRLLLQRATTRSTGADTGCWPCAPDGTRTAARTSCRGSWASCASTSRRTGTRLLDVFTVHYYPQGGEFGE